MLTSSTQETRPLKFLSVLHLAKMTTRRILATGLVCMLVIVMALVQGTPTPKVKFVATADGKSYFQEYEPFRNWTEAGDYCASMNMRLATITSAAQAAALMAASDEGFRGQFWTAGRDAGTHRQFSWNETNEETGNFMPVVQHVFHVTCLAYHHPFIHMEGSPCSEKIGTLCEI